MLTNALSSTGDQFFHAEKPAFSSGSGKKHIVHVLEKTGWHKGQACEILDISRPKLERRIHEFNLSPPDRDSGN